MKEKIWAILVHLSMDMWRGEQNALPLSEVFDEDMWHDIIDEAEKCGMNAIVLDVGNGVRFASHPEIAKEDAYSSAWVKAEVKRCKEKGTDTERQSRRCNHQHLRTHLLIQFIQLLLFGNRCGCRCQNRPNQR